MKTPLLKIVVDGFGGDSAVENKAAKAPKKGKQSDSEQAFSSPDSPCCRRRGGFVLKVDGSQSGDNEHDGEAQTDQDEAKQGGSAQQHPLDCNQPCCRRHLIEMLGRGKEKYELPTVEQVVETASIMLAASKLNEAGILQQVDDSGDVEEPFAIHTNRAVASALNSSPGLLDMMRMLMNGSNAKGVDRSRMVKRMRAADGSHSKQNKKTGRKKNNMPMLAPASGSEVEPTAGEEQKLKANPNALRVLAEVTRLIFYDGRFDAVVARKFNPSRNVLERNRRSAPARYQPSIESLDDHFARLRELYKEALPQVFDMLRAQYKDADDTELREAALQILDQQEELAQILYVLQHYVDAFSQLEDPFYEPLQAVIAVVEEAFNLFLTGNIEASRVKVRKAIAESTYFLIGNVFLAHAGEDGPATIPGANGPVGVHLVLVPEDEVGIIMLMMVLYLHEFRHDVFADIKGLPEETAKAVLADLQGAMASGQVKLSAKSITLGKTKVALADLICLLFLNNIGEIDADLVGGIEMCGWSFALNMCYVFGAFNSKKDGAIRTKRLLRTFGYFSISEAGELEFEEHPVDYLRVHILAAALELIGFADEAAEIRALADAAAGSEIPEFLTYVDISGKRRQQIKIRFSDLVQCAPVVAKAILMTPLKALNGKSNHDVVTWARKCQDKTDMLVANLMAGKADVPEGKGDFYLTYLAAASTIAFYQLIANGRMDPTEVPAFVNSNALEMHRTILRRLAEKRSKSDKAEADTQTSPSGVVSTEDPASGTTGNTAS